MHPLPKKILDPPLGMGKESITLTMELAKTQCYEFEGFENNIQWLERFSYDLEMKSREQNRNNKPMEMERFDWFIERIQTHVAFGWLSERSGEETSCPRTF